MTIAILATLLVVQTSPSLLCGSLPITEDVACAQNTYGIVVADDQITADRFAAAASGGEDRFLKAFGQDPRPYAVLVGDRVNPIGANGETASVSWQARLQALGAENVLPWFTDAQKALIRRGSGEGLPDNEDSAVAHELGHFWAIGTFWPNQRRGPGITPVYASPAPDWLDETLAVLMEDSSLNQQRVNAFLREWKSATGHRPKPLVDFFRDAHPVFRADAGFTIRAEDLPPGARIIERPPAGGTVRTGDPAPDAGTVGAAPQGARPQRFTVSRATPNARLVDPASAEYFYVQVRLLADFLLETSQKPMLFARLVQAHAENRTMDEWLASDGKGFGLPGTVADLDARFRAWLAERYGPAA